VCTSYASLAYIRETANGREEEEEGRKKERKKNNKGKRKKGGTKEQLCDTHGFVFIDDTRLVSGKSGET